jgi:putative ABC transport system permease protein
MNLIQDLRYAARAAWRDRGFSLVAVLTLALGIGANTALFTIVNAVLLEPLPFKQPEQLVRVTADFAGQKVADAGLSIPELFDLQRSGLFDQMSGVWPVSANLTETDEPERVETALVDANYFAMLGVGAQLGRVFDESDRIPGITEVAVISDGIWKRRFGSDPHVLGKRIRIDNDMYSIIGVAPVSFRHPGRGTQTDVDVWAPAGWLASPFSPEPVRRAYLLQGGIGRLRSGVTPAAAQRRIDILVGELRQAFPSDYPPAARWTLRVIPLHEDLVGNVRPALVTLLVAVGFVLLIACANVASLLLARSSARQREIAIRRAVGAGRGRLVAQLLTESVMLASIGGIAGLFVALWGIDALVHLSPTDLPRLHAVGVNGAVLGFTAALSLVTGVIFGLAPAIQGSNADLQQVLRESSPGSGIGTGVARLRAVLVVGEFALALVLLVGAALMIQSFWRLQGVELGFRPDAVLTARLWLPQPNDPKTGPYFTHDARVSFYRRVQEHVAALPGVQAVGGTSVLPLSGARGRISFAIEGRPADAGDTSAAEGALATPDYFHALGIDLLRGRIFDDHDDGSRPIVGVVSESFVRLYFPNEDPIGRRLFPGGRLPAPNAPTPRNAITIVGVVRDIKTGGLEVGAAPLLYRSVWQVSNLNLTLVVRASGDPVQLSEAIRREVRVVDPNEPVFGVRTMNEVVAIALAQRRFTMLLLALFAATALALSAIGIYGVMAYFVTQRTHEIGIRMALGASRRAVLGMVLGQGAKLAAGGVVAGLLGAVAMTRAIAALLFDVSPRDPATLVALSLALCAIAMLACYVPARRATRVDPIRALRYE